jgi:hypothetical protein
MDPSGRKSRKPAAVIKGTDTEDGGACDAGAEADSWRITAVVSEDQSKIFVDFSPKVSRVTPASLSLSISLSVSLSLSRALSLIYIHKSVTPASLPVHVRAHTLTYIQITHTCTHTYTSKHPQHTPQTHTHTCMYVCICIHTCIYIYIHTPIRPINSYTPACYTYTSVSCRVLLYLVLFFRLGFSLTIYTPVSHAHKSVS